jgi:D-3-phosphoglycerate dehydrogenase / 2-oxoglutarate reductase
MKNKFPTIHWCWPEVLRQNPDVSEALSGLGTVCPSETLPTANQGVNILVPRLTQEIDFAQMEELPDLRIIATPSTGTDHIDLDEAKRRDIRVVSLRFDSPFLDTLSSTAELTWLLVLACMRRFRTANTNAMEGPWDSMACRGNELNGKTLGIVGLGRLGTMVARFGLAFRMRVIACDVRDVEVEGVTRVSLEELLTSSDVVSIHVHLDKSTGGYIGAEQFRLMKPGAILVNTSRGAVLDEAALLDALKSGRLSAAGLDVLKGERSADLQSHPLIQYARHHDNLILTPHVGGCTVEAQSKAFLHITRKISDTWHTLEQK